MPSAPICWPATQPTQPLAAVGAREDVAPNRLANIPTAPTDWRCDRSARARPGIDRQAQLRRRDRSGRLMRRTRSKEPVADPIDAARPESAANRDTARWQSRAPDACVRSAPRLPCRPRRRTLAGVLAKATLSKSLSRSWASSVSRNCHESGSASATACSRLPPLRWASSRACVRSATIPLATTSSSAITESGNGRKRIN